MVCHHSTKKPAYFWAGLICGFLMFLASPARAASVSFFLDQSNELPDGVPYLSVTLTENGTGGVDFLVQTLDGLNDIADRNFGIQKFGFNFVDDAWGDISGLPAHWRMQQNKRMDGFGRFDIRLQGKGRARTDNLSFTVDGADLGDFGPLFSAHVAGFEWCRVDEPLQCNERDCTTSAYFAGYMDVPVAHTPLPASAWLFGSGLLGLIGFARRKTTR